MTRRADATLAAIVALLAEAGHGPGDAVFRARDVAPLREAKVRVASRTVELHLCAAGYATRTLWVGVMMLTPAGLDAVEAARAAKAAPASPCVAECALDLHTGWCRGCARTRAEIAAWRDMPAAERARVMEALPGRRGACGAVDGVGGAP